MGKTIIHSVRLFDGTEVYPDSTVTFDSESGIITSVSTESSTPSNGSYTNGHSSDAITIDGSGQTLLPGLIDAHIHCHKLHLPPGGEIKTILSQALKCGITTVCDMHSDPEIVHEHRQRVQDDLLAAKNNAKSGKGGGVSYSDLKSCLYGAMIEGGWPKPIVLGHNPTDQLKAIVATWPSVTIETAPAFVKSHKANGANYIKLMQENCCSLVLPTNSIPVATLDLQTAVVNAAHAEGLLVVGHALSADMTEIVLRSGANGLTHTFVDQPPPENIIDLYKRTNAFVIPTLCILSSLTNEEQEFRDKFAGIADAKGIIDEFVKENMLSVLGMKAATAKVEYAYQTIQRLRQEGIDIVAGTDAAAGLKGGAVGPSLWMELELYVKKCGMSVIEALRSATSVTARRFEFADRGEIKVGKRADLVLVGGDVIKDLSSLWEGQGILGVWKQGFKAQ